MSGLFGGGNDGPSQPQRSPNGVRITKVASDPDTILGRPKTGTGVNGATSLLTEEDERERQRSIIGFNIGATGDR